MTAIRSKQRPTQANGEQQTQQLVQRPRSSTARSTSTRSVVDPFFGLGEHEAFSLLPNFGTFRSLQHQPRVNLRDTGNEFELDIDLPGISKQDVQLSVTNDRLEIHAESQQKEEASDGDYVIREIGQRSYTRSIPLPAEADVENVEAEFEDGCLCVTIGKREDTETARRNIKIR